MILFQEHTRQILENSLAGGVHGLLLTGPIGAGKSYTARYYAQQKLGLASMEKLDGYPYFSDITPENSSISIEQIRGLQKFLQLKVPGQAGIRRVAIIEDAHLMTSEAQNALLKSLEEPPSDTVLILTAPATLRLKRTIYSRVQQVPILPVSKRQAVDYFQNDFKGADIEKNYAISDGRMGLLHALLNSEDHALLEEIRRAKQIFGDTAFGRLAKVDELSKQKESLPLFLQACKLICSAALHNAAGKGADAKQLKHWHRSLGSVYEAEAALAHNPNSKLLLTDLLLSL